MKNLLAMLLALFVLCGCVTKSPAAQDRPYPTTQEIKADLYRRQHESFCSTVQRKLWDRQAKDALSGKPLAQVNSVLPAEQHDVTLCAAELAIGNAAIAKAVGCYVGFWGSNGGYAGFTLSGPQGRVYSITTNHDGQSSRFPDVKMGHYYEITYWHWEGKAKPDELDHSVSVVNLGSCYASEEKK